MLKHEFQNSEQMNSFLLRDAKLPSRHAQNYVCHKNVSVPSLQSVWNLGSYITDFISFPEGMKTSLPV